MLWLINSSGAGSINTDTAALCSPSGVSYALSIFASVFVSLSWPYTVFPRNAEGGVCLQRFSKAFEVMSGRGCRGANISVPSSVIPLFIIAPPQPPTTPRHHVCFSLAFFWIGEWNSFFPGREVHKSWQLPSAPTTHWAQYELKEPLYSALYSSTPLSSDPLLEINEEDETFMGLFGLLKKSLNSKTGNIKTGHSAHKKSILWLHLYCPQCLHDLLLIYSNYDFTLHPTLHHLFKHTGMTFKMRTAFTHFLSVSYEYILQICDKLK